MSNIGQFESVTQNRVVKRFQISWVMPVMGCYKRLSSIHPT